MKLPLVLLFLLSFAGLFAQKRPVWYPYEEAGKLGWKMADGSHNLPPTLNFIFVHYPIVATKSGKTGLIDTTGRLVADTIYSLLKLIQPHYLENDAGWTYQNSFLLYTKDTVNTNWYTDYHLQHHLGLMGLNGTLITPPDYHDIQKINNYILSCFSGKPSWKVGDKITNHFRIFSIADQSLKPLKYASIGSIKGTRDLILASFSGLDATGSYQAAGFVVMDSLGREVLLLDKGLPFDEHLTRYYHSICYYPGSDYNWSSWATPLTHIAGQFYEYEFLKDKLIDSNRIEWSFDLLTYKRVTTSVGEYFTSGIRNLGKTLYLSANAHTIYNSKGDTILHVPEVFFARKEGQNLQVYNENGKIGLWSLKGKELIPTICDSAFRGYGTYIGSWIDGKQVWFDANFNRLWQNGLEIVEREDRNKDHNHLYIRNPETRLIGLSDLAGVIIVQPEFDTVYPVEWGFVVERNGKKGLAGPNGKLLIELQYDNLYGYSADHITATLGDKTGIVNAQNRILVPLEYDRVDGTGNYLIVSKNHKYGMLSKDQSASLPLKYKWAKWISPDTLIQLRAGKEMIVYSTVSKKQVRLGNIKKLYGEYAELKFKKEQSKIEIVIMLNDDDQYIESSKSLMNLDGSWCAREYAKHNASYSFFSRKKEGRFILTDSAGNQLQSDEWDEITFSADNVALLKKGEIYYYWNTLVSEPVQGRYDHFVFQFRHAKGSGYVVCNYGENETVVLLDSLFQPLFPEVFSWGTQYGRYSDFRNGEVKLKREELYYLFDTQSGELKEVPPPPSAPTTEAHTAPRTAIQPTSTAHTNYVLPDRPTIIGEWQEFQNVLKGSDGKHIYWMTRANQVYHISEVE